MGWLVGFEPTYVRVTVVSVDRFTIATITIIGAPEGIRTPGPRLRRPLLYPTELQAHMVGETRFELATPCSQGRCATRLRYSPIHARAELISRMNASRKHFDLHFYLAEKLLKCQHLLHLSPIMSPRPNPLPVAHQKTYMTRICKEMLQVWETAILHNLLLSIK